MGLGGKPPVVVGAPSLPLEVGDIAEAPPTKQPWELCHRHLAARCHECSLVISAQCKARGRRCV